MKYILVSIVALAGCMQDETVAAYGGGDNIWRLTHVNGTAYTANATLEFGEDGAVGGQAPCNRWFGTQTAPYPWFSLTAIGATKRACPDLAAEQSFFKALRNMSLSEVSGTILRLSNDTGGEMLFEARQNP